MKELILKSIRVIQKRIGDLSSDDDLWVRGYIAGVNDITDLIKDLECNDIKNDK